VASWYHFEAEAPALAEIAARLWPGITALHRGGAVPAGMPCFAISYLASIRRDGGPRLLDVGQPGTRAVRQQWRPAERQPQRNGQISLCRAIASISQHAAQVNDHLIINVLAGRRRQEFQLGPYLDGELAVMTLGDLAEGFQQRHDRAPLDVVASGMLHDLAQRIPMAAVKMF
jgi:hypothetical protein